MRSPSRRGQFRSAALIGSLVLATALSLSAAVVLRGDSAAAAGAAKTRLVPPGWAFGGKDNEPKSQYEADAADLKREGCGENTALLFRLRGSGAAPGGYPIGDGPSGDHTGAWLIGAGAELVRRGWRVRGLQAIYDKSRPNANAPSTPEGASMANPLKWKAFRDAATDAAPLIKRALIEAYERCPARSILIAGHSFGNIVLRIILPQLKDHPLLKKVVRVDLFSDPTADKAVDEPLQHPADLDGRLTNAGVDTQAARLAWKAGTFVVAGRLVAAVVNFRQKPHPIADRVFQYCVPGDVVCDVNPVNVGRLARDSGRKRQASIHVQYQFAVAGRQGARSLKAFDLSSKVSAGREHTCAVMPDETVRCWGSNRKGQLGDGTTTDRLKPVTIKGLANVRAIDAGDQHTCALLENATVKCWGLNYYGQIGDGTTVDRTRPTSVVRLSNVVAISAGNEHTCAIVRGGNGWCWGEPDNGQLGRNVNPGPQLTPVSVVGFPGRMTAISSGGYHTCGLTSGGAVWCWGQNFYGESGHGLPGSRWTPLQAVGLSSGVKAIDSSDHESCALFHNGHVTCWGKAYQRTPVDVSFPAAVDALGVGWGHLCALMRSGEVRCVGSNFYGQLGNGTTTASSSSVPVAGLDDIASLESGRIHSCSAFGNGAVRCWGKNDRGQLGDGTRTNRSKPTGVAGFPTP